MKYNVSEIIDFNIISAFQSYSLAIFIITVILEIFYGIIVFLTTSKSMQFFRILTFIYIFECILVEFIMLCWKPFRLFPFTIFYPTGILAPMSSTASALLTALFPFGIACFFETLTIIVAERHFRILGNATKMKKTRFWVYFFQGITFIFAVVPLFTFMIQNINDTKVLALLKSEVENIDQILILQPSLFSIDYTYSTTLWSFFVAAFFYAIFRILLFAFILKENYKFVKSKQKNISEKTRKQFFLMFQSTMIQFLTTMVFGFFALIWVISFFISEATDGIKFAYYITIGIVLCYPAADVIIVVTVVKGYRNTLKKIFIAVTGKSNRKISGFGFHNISMNNNNNNNNQQTMFNTVIARRKASMY